MRVGKGALVGAGSTIASDVPDDSLAVTRAKQMVREGAASSFRRRKQREKAADKKTGG